MKIFRFPFDAVQAELLFEPIRTRIGTVRLLMKAIKHILVHSMPEPDQQIGEIVLVVSKMSRLFFVRDSQIASIAFPFSVIDGAEGLEFRSKYHPAIDNRVTSAVIGLLSSNDVLRSDQVFDFAERIQEDSGFDPCLWDLFRHLLLEEDGYIRYDHDPQRANGHQHPAHHLDVFYSGSATFKLGLRGLMTTDSLCDVLDFGTDCFYLSAPR